MGNSDFCVYIGPTIRNVIQRGTVYAGRKRDVMNKISYALKKYPLIEKLLIPGEELAESRKRVREPGTYLNALYKRLTREEKHGH